MVIKEIFQHNYSTLSDTITQVGAAAKNATTEAAKTAESAATAAKSATLEAAKFSETAAKAAVNAATHPQDVVKNVGERTVNFGKHALADIDAVRIKSKADDEPVPELPQSLESEKWARLRSDVSTHLQA